MGKRGIPRLFKVVGNRRRGRYLYIIRHVYPITDPPVYSCKYNYITNLK